MKIPRALQVFVGVLSTWMGLATSNLEVALRDYSPAPTAESNCSDWMEWVPPRTEPGIIMQVVTKGYLLVQENFIALLEANSGFTRDNIFLMCLDRIAEREVAAMGIRCVPMFGQWDGDLSFVWKLRVKVLSCLVKAGHSVVLTDSDALWLKDPQLDFELPEVRDSSIVASRGSFPNDLGTMWGATLCMGFILFRAGAGTERILAVMERLVHEVGDDQKAVNYAVKDLGIEWDPNTDMRYIESTGLGKGTIGGIVEGDAGLNVTLLPHDKYTRKCNEVPIGPQTMVAHCHSKKTGKSKTEWMRIAHLWVVGDMYGPSDNASSTRQEETKDVGV